MAAEAGRQWRIAVGESVSVIAPDGGEATPRAKKARALLAYLAATPAGTASRAELIALLWSDRGRDQARASLRQCLFGLRSEAPGLIDADGETVSLAAGVIVDRAGAPRLNSLEGVAPGCDGWLDHRRDADAVATAAAEGRAVIAPLPRSWGVSVALALLLTALTPWWSLRRPPAAEPGLTVIAVGPFAATDGTRAAAAIAERMSDDLLALLPAERALVRVNEELRPRHPRGLRGNLPRICPASFGLGMAGQVQLEIWHRAPGDELEAHVEAIVKQSQKEARKLRAAIRSLQSTLPRNVARGNANGVAPLEMALLAVERAISLTAPSAARDHARSKSEGSANVPELDPIEAAVSALWQGQTPLLVSEGLNQPEGVPLPAPKAGFKDRYFVRRLFFAYRTSILEDPDFLPAKARRVICRATGKGFNIKHTQAGH